MDYAYSELLAKAQEWAGDAVAEDRLTAEQAQDLLALEHGSPEQLFDNGLAADDVRPLIVAFMGGTGVGKSSLLNRLAGKQIAKAGVERPTSREVTLYHHHSLALNRLPAGLPLESVKCCQHDDADNAHVVWIDMPDFDSVELANRRLVLEWLPHIDVLLYVVSPERYRDNKAWQMLLAEGGKHAWLFVMNQWDRGLAVQFDDFKQQLAKAGFLDPILFKTSCAEPAGDEFGQLQTQLRQLADRGHLSELVSQVESRRLRVLQQSLQALQAHLAGRNYALLTQILDDDWPGLEAELNQGLAWPLQQMAQAWAGHLALQQPVRLWDDWAQNRLQDLLDRLVLQGAQFDMPTKPLKSALQTLADVSESRVVNQVELAGRQALLKPGNGLQRFLLKLTAICEALLPLSAMALVGYQVFVGYYQSSAKNAAYLGADFAAHSLLLIGLSWLIPFFLHKKIQPSLEKAADKGLQKGLQQALAALRTEIRLVLHGEHDRNQALLQQLIMMQTQCCQQQPLVSAQRDLLGRVLKAE